MNVKELITLLINRISHLTSQKSHAVNIGDVEQVLKLENEILTTENTVSQLKNLKDAE
jgi:hypothetical protein